MGFIEIDPGVIYFDRGIDYASLSDEAEYSPDHYLAFNGFDFESYLTFLEYIKTNLNLIYLKNLDYDIRISVGEIDKVVNKGSDYFIINFENTKIILKIPPRSDILNIERDILYFSLYINNNIWYLEQPIKKLDQFFQIIKGLVNK